MGRRRTKWCKEPHFSRMMKAVIAVRFRKESSTIIAAQTNIPARTIRRYVQISKDPTRANDSCFFMTEDPNLGNEAQASMPVGNDAHTSLSSDVFKIDDQMNIHPTET